MCLSEISKQVYIYYNDFECRLCWNSEIVTGEKSNEFIAICHRNYNKIGDVDGCVLKAAKTKDTQKILRE